MKLLVDEMPKSPEKCIFSEFKGFNRIGNKAFLCLFRRNKNCNVVHCKFLKQIKSNTID